MNEVHLNFLIQSGSNDQGYVGSNSLKWANSVLPNTKFDPYLDKRFNRYELFEYCKNKDNSNLNVLVSILSWGGMNRIHARALFSNLDPVLLLVDNLRNGKYKSRKSAFSSFQNNRSSGLLPGLGIGYFTKLICFLSPDLKGYILDQWAGKSINLLTGLNIVSITPYGWVDDTNNSDTYETFCNYIDALSIRLNCSGFEAEKRIFSVGRGRGVWRNYLILNYDNQIII